MAISSYTNRWCVFVITARYHFYWIDYRWVRGSLEQLLVSLAHLFIQLDQIVFTSPRKLKQKRLTFTNLNKYKCPLTNSVNGSSRIYIGARRPFVVWI